MDEPLSNLDARPRVTMRAELRHLHRELGATSVCARGSPEFEAAIDAPIRFTPKPGTRVHLLDRPSGQRLDGTGV